MTTHHTIPDPPPITDRMMDGGLGIGPYGLIGTVVCVYEVTDSDRRECLLRYDDGRVIGVSCDPGLNDDASMSRNPKRWEVVLYDATDTDAGRAMQDLAPGHWM